MERRFGAGADETDLLRAWDRFNDAFRQFDDRFVQRVIGRTERGLSLHGFDDGGMRVSDQQWSGPHQVIDEFASINVVDFTSLSPRDDDGRSAGSRKAPSDPPRTSDGAIKQLLLAT